MADACREHLKVGDLVWIVEESNPRFTIRLLGLKNSGTAPTASPAPPSSARRPDRSSAHSLSLYRSSQHFFRAGVCYRLNEQRYLNESEKVFLHHVSLISVPLYVESSKKNLFNIIFVDPNIKLSRLRSF